MPIAEDTVREALKEVMKGRTVIAIAHRLTAVRHADLFIVLEDGRIVESGGHDELMLNDGLYKRLYELQAV